MEAAITENIEELYRSHMNLIKVLSCNNKKHTVIRLSSQERVI